MNTKKLAEIDQKLEEQNFETISKESIEDYLNAHKYSNKDLWLYLMETGKIDRNRLKENVTTILEGRNEQSKYTDRIMYNLDSDKEIVYWAEDTWSDFNGWAPHEIKELFN